MSNTSQSMFITHLNYVRCMAEQFSGLHITTTLAPNSAVPVTNIDRFQRLADLTKQSIDSEYKASNIAHDYAEIVVSWLPAKCYYRLYYLESILIYLLNNNSSGFGRGGHKGVRKAISFLINNNELIFSNTEISTQTTIKMIRAHKITSGANLSPTYYASPDCINSVRKKLSEYKEHDWKSSRGITKYSSASSRLSRDNFYSTNTLNLTDFFYWMRIKVNYRDLDFLDFSSSVTPNDAYNYFTYYYQTYNEYAIAVEKLIAQLRKMRGI